MGFFKKFGAVVLAAVLLMNIGGCTNKKSKAVSVNGESMSGAMYVYQLMQQKASYLSENSLTETEDMWDGEYDDEYTLGEYIQTLVLDNMINTLVWRTQFDKLGLSFTEAEQKEIDDAISKAEEAAGGKDALQKTLDQYDLNYYEYIQSVYYDTQKIYKIVDYYYGENGLEPVDEKTLLSYFKENYVRAKHILISTLDSEGAAMTGSAMTKAKQTAQSVYEKAKGADEKTFDELIKQYNEDEGVASYPDGYLFTTGEMVEEFEEAAFDMAVGETRMIQSDYGFHIIRKLSLEDEKVYTAQVRHQMLLQLKATELTAMVKEWREAAKIKIGRGVLSKYTCKSVESVSGTNTSDGTTAQEIADKLGLTDEDLVEK